MAADLSVARTSARIRFGVFFIREGTSAQR
jgi:hypothetical protein